jgi:hypothetical protein
MYTSIVAICDRNASPKLNITITGPVTGSLQVTFKSAMTCPSQAYTCWDNTCVANGEVGATLAECDQICDPLKVNWACVREQYLCAFHQQVSVKGRL